MRAARTLLREVDKLISEVRGVPPLEDFIDYGDKIEIVLDVASAEPKVTYSNGEFIVEYGSNVKKYHVGKIDEKSIEADVRNGVLSIKARRVKDAGKTKESVQEEEDKEKSDRKGTRAGSKGGD